jgi:DNA-binding NtrC family response regulator
MSLHPLHLIIVDDNPQVLAELRTYLDKRFNNGLLIATFSSGSEALAAVNETTSIVILDYHLEHEDGNAVLKAIKAKNPNVQVIMHSSNEEMAVMIDSFRKGASNYIVKGRGARKKLTAHLYQIITYPVRIIVKEFGINKYLALFLITFIAVGAVVVIALQYTA